MQTVFSQAVGEHLGQAAFGVFVAVAYGVGSLWAMVIGQIVDLAGFDAAFYAMACSFVAAASILALMKRGGSQ